MVKIEKSGEWKHGGLSVVRVVHGGVHGHTRKSCVCASFHMPGGTSRLGIATSRTDSSMHALNCQSAWCCVHRLQFSLRWFLSQMWVMASRVGSACCQSTWRRRPRSFILVGLSDGGQLGSRFWFVQLQAKRKRFDPDPRNDLPSDRLAQLVHTMSQ